jgi:hypothetical protein
MSSVFIPLSPYFYIPFFVFKFSLFSSFSIFLPYFLLSFLSAFLRFLSVFLCLLSCINCLCLFLYFFYSLWYFFPLRFPFLPSFFSFLSVVFLFLLFPFIYSILRSVFNTFFVSFFLSDPLFFPFFQHSIWHYFYYTQQGSVNVRKLFALFIVYWTYVQLATITIVRQNQLPAWPAREAGWCNPIKHSERLADGALFTMHSNRMWIYSTKFQTVWNYRNVIRWAQH